VHGEPVGLTLEATRTMERAFGVEGRHPFFDPALVQFLVSLPIEERFRDGVTKILLLRVLGDFLTVEARTRVTKTNYLPYFDRALRLHHARDLERWVTGGASVLDPYLDRDRTRRLVQGYLGGDGTNRMVAWRLLVLERFFTRPRSREEGSTHEEAEAVEAPSVNPSASEAAESEAAL